MFVYGAGQCFAIKFKVDDTLKIINVYFPCYSNTAHYTEDLNNFLDFIENLLQHQGDVNWLGVSISLALSSPGILRQKHVLGKLNVAHSDDLVSDVNPGTFVKSRIKLFFFH